VLMAAACRNMISRHMAYNVVFVAFYVFVIFESSSLCIYTYIRYDTIWAGNILFFRDNMSQAS